MPIDLGLKRVSRLASLLGNPQQSYNSVHIAGTNGKGSICAYISSILTESRIKNGKFTSPHLIRRSDCISINNVAVPHSDFLMEELRVKQVDVQYGLQCTEFEILTCTLFEIFKRQKVDVAVVEVGLGGRLDATNILQPINKEFANGVIATGISKIGLDHEGILGNTLQEIATEKAGIMKPGVPCIVDGTNADECILLFEEVSKKMGSELSIIKTPQSTLTKFGNVNEFQIPLLGQYQLANLSIALKIIELISPRYSKITTESVKQGISRVKWPGRLQTVELALNNRKISVLIDGAHNGSAAIELSKYIQSHTSTVFIMAVTLGKTLPPLISPLVRAGDTVIVTEFSAVDGMPWIKCYPAEELLEKFKDYTSDVMVEKDLKEAIIKADSTGKDIVICGSLYLIADVIRLNE